MSIYPCIQGDTTHSDNNGINVPILNLPPALKLTRVRNDMSRVVDAVSRLAAVQIEVIGVEYSAIVWE